MKILKWVLTIVVVIVLALLAFLWYMGIFSSVKVTEREMGPFTIAYERYVGEYKDTGKAFMNVHSVMTSLSMEVSDKSDSLGIYYDDPAKVAKDKLKSDCGIVIAKKDMSKIWKLRSKGLKVMTLPKKMSVVAEFPIRNVMSYMIGPAKAYPVLMKYAVQKNYKAKMMYEFYDMKAGKILFTLVIAK
ncbi:MAG: hypothetical protein WC624_06895 [Candidatus Margulisiibacteriota bacterium]